MTFSEQLNKYIKQIECSSKDLVISSGLTSSVISRYRRGDRTPSLKSKQLEQLTDGLYKLSLTREMNITKEEIYTALSDTLNDISIDFEQLSKNFNELVTTLNINVAELSRLSSYDASFLSRIRTGNGNPSHPKDFATAVCNFIMKKYTSDDDKKAVALLINSTLEELENNLNYFNKLFNWFTTNSTPSHNYIDDFLTNLDKFDLNEYIKAIHFDEMKVPTIPFYKATSKTYYGIEEMKKGELDFFKATVLSKNNEPVFMCSDMPMEDMAKDIDFGKKWMFAIAMCLKKGHHLNIIHNLDRPFNEMMLGLESWIPIYMTGQISPYYLSNLKNNIYNHLNYVSAAAALSGECINGFHNKGMYYLTTNKNEIEYYKEKSDLLLKKAKPLMEIYRENNIKEYHLFLKKEENIECDRTRYISSLPLFTISDELLIKILKRNKLTKEEIDKIIKYKNNEFKYMNSILKKNKVFDYIYVIKENEFISDTPSLLLNNLFIDKTINYTYKEYIEHLKLTNEYAKNNKNYNILTEKDKTFKNITITILKNNHVIISKNSNPTIHFVIRHPKLVAAIESFNPLVKEL